MPRKKEDAESGPEKVVAYCADLTPRPLRRPRRPALLAQDTTAGQLRRLVVLIGCFNAIATPGTGPARLVEQLRSIIGAAHAAFGGPTHAQEEGRRIQALDPEQRNCLLHLERVCQGLAQQSPDSWRDLDHALDGLLVQCLLLESADRTPRDARADGTGASVPDALRVG